MSEWNVPKIREECLKLMGWKHDPTLGLWGGPFVNWRDPSGKHVLESGIPDPTTSLDDALPLMEKYKITLAPPRLVLRPGELVSLWTAESSGTVTEHEDAMVAVCLCALRIKHHDLKDFEIAPKKNARKR